MKALTLFCLVSVGLTAGVVCSSCMLGASAARAVVGIGADCLEMALCSWTVCDD